LTLEEEITTPFGSSDTNHTATLRHILDSRFGSASSTNYSTFAINFRAAKP